MSGDDNREKLIKAGLSRDERCAASLRVSRLQDLQLSDQPGACFLVTMIGDSAKCKTCPLPERCMCLRDHFQSTNNSKRRVSTHLFWKNKLGLGFPVADRMLTRAVWGALSSCEHGIKEGNGQRKKANGAVCVNPYCYKPVNYFKVMKPMAQTFAVLGIDQDDIVGKALGQLGWNGHDFAPPAGIQSAHVEKGFELISAVVRQMHFKGSPPEQTAVPDVVATGVHQQMQLRLAQQQQATLASYQMRVQQQMLLQQQVEINAAGIVTLGSVDAAPVQPRPSPQPDEAVSMSPPSDTGYESASPNVSANSTPEYAPGEYYQTRLPPEYYSAATPAVPAPAQPGAAQPSLADVWAQNHGGLDLGDVEPVAAKTENIVVAAQNESWTQTEQEEISLLEALLRGEDPAALSGVGAAEALPGAPPHARPASPPVQLTPDTASFPADLDGVDSSWLAYIDAQTAVAPTGQVEVMSGLSIPSESTAQRMASAEQIVQVPPLPYGGQASPVGPTSQIITSSGGGGATAMSFGSISAVHGGQMVQRPTAGNNGRIPSVVCRAFCRKCKRWTGGEERPTSCSITGCVSDDLFVERIPADRAAVLPKVEAAQGLEEGDIVGVLEHAGTVSIVRLDAVRSDSVRGVGVVAQSGEDERMMCMMGVGRIKVRGPIRAGQTIFAAVGADDVSTVGVAEPPRRHPPVAVGRALEDVEAVDPRSVALVRSVIVGTGARTGGKITPSLVATVNHSFKTKLAAGAGADADAAALAMASLSVDDADRGTVGHEEIAMFRRLEGGAPDDETVVMLRSAAAGGVPLAVGTDGAVGCFGTDGPASWWVVHAAEGGTVRLQGASSDNEWLCATPSGALVVSSNADSPGTAFSIGKDRVESGGRAVQVGPGGSGIATLCNTGAATTIHVYVRHAGATLLSE